MKIQKNKKKAKKIPTLSNKRATISRHSSVMFGWSLNVLGSQLFGQGSAESCGFKTMGRKRGFVNTK